MQEAACFLDDVLISNSLYWKGPFFGFPVLKSSDFPEFREVTVGFPDLKNSDFPEFRDMKVVDSWFELV